MTAGVQLHCAGCDRRLGKRATITVIGAATPLCGDCGASPRVHRQLFWSCRVPGCCAVDHDNRVTTTAGRARQLLGSTP
jgi:uncharacterized membrane protein